MFVVQYSLVLLKHVIVIFSCHGHYDLQIIMEDNFLHYSGTQNQLSPFNEYGESSSWSLSKVIMLKTWGIYGSIQCTLKKNVHIFTLWMYDTALELLTVFQVCLFPKKSQSNTHSMHVTFSPIPIWMTASLMFKGRRYVCAFVGLLVLMTSFILP